MSERKHTELEKQLLEALRLLYRSTQTNMDVAKALEMAYKAISATESKE